MSYYPALKQRLTCREVAPRYGLKLNASGMALCPFHDEHSPSLKLSRGFHCFGCGAQGDVITFVSRLFGIPPGGGGTKAVRRFWDFCGRLPSRPTDCPNRNGDLGSLREGNSSRPTTIYWLTGSEGIAQRNRMQNGTRCLSKHFKDRRTFAS